MLELSNYASKKELKNGTRVDISNSAAKIDFIALNADIYRLGIK